MDYPTFDFAVKDATGGKIQITVECLENGYLRIKTCDAHGKLGAYLVQHINGKWHRHKLSMDDGVVDTCPVHDDGRHVHDEDAMTVEEMWFSTDIRVVGNVLPPKKCKCGQVKYLGL